MEPSTARHSNFWVPELGNGIPPAAVVRRERVPHDLDVLLRHRPRSISLNPAGRQCQGRQVFGPFSSGLALPPLVVRISGH